MNYKTDKYAFAALKNKHATIASEIVQIERQLRHKRERLMHVNACLTLFDPKASPESIPNKRLMKHVKLFRAGDLRWLIIQPFESTKVKISLTC